MKEVWQSALGMRMRMRMDQEYAMAVDLPRRLMNNLMLTTTRHSGSSGRVNEGRNEC